MLLILIPIAIAWLGIATLVVCLCRMAALGDAQPTRRGPRAAARAELPRLDRAPASSRPALSARGVRRPRPVTAQH